MLHHIVVLKSAALNARRLDLDDDDLCRLLSCLSFSTLAFNIIISSESLLLQLPIVSSSFSSPPSLWIVSKSYLLIKKLQMQPHLNVSLLVLALPGLPLPIPLSVLPLPLSIFRHQLPPLVRVDVWPLEPFESLRLHPYRLLR